MTHETEILFNEPGIQYQGVSDASGGTETDPVQGLMVGHFRRGRLDKPMIIHRDNIRAMLGHDPKNPYYTAVLDILGQGVPFIHVLRMIDGEYEGGPVIVPPVIVPPVIVPPVIVPPVLDNPVDLKDFDYGVIRYKWTREGGTDLDTRTLITQPPRNVVVGWNRQQTDGDYLSWGGDNTGSGVEAVLIDIKKLKQDFLSINEFLIQIRAFWYSSRNNGTVTIQFESYKGGSMSPSGYDFVNSGGVLVQSMHVNTNSTSSDRDGQGQLLATLAYNPIQNTGTLS